MRISKLYIKIFVSVLVGLVVAELLIFGAFRRFYREEYRAQVREFIDAQAILMRSFVVSRQRDGASYSEITAELGSILPARVWVLDRAGRPLAASIERDPPRLDHGGGHRTKQGVRFSFRDDGLLAMLPIPQADGSEAFFLFEFQRKPHRPGDQSFALGLLGVALAFALLLYPVSSLLGRPLRELRNSVLRIADGDLNHRVRVRSSDEIGELGRAFNQMADRVERMVNGTRELTAHVSHELRSPLARIRVATQLLSEAREGSDGANQRAHLRAIQEEIEDLDRLIGRILQLSRLDLRPPEQPATRSLHAVLQEIRELSGRYEAAFARRQLRLVLRAPEVGAVTARYAAWISYDDLRTILSAVLDNALKYASAPDADADADAGADSYGARRDIVEIDVRLEPAPGSDWLVLRVRNACEPLRESDLRRIFEPFQRVIGGDEPGEGLGLAIAHKTVQNAAGEIRATNWPGAPAGLAPGIEIEIRLPLSLPESRRYGGAPPDP
jgi:two-component system sensor histidine kinase CpxA